MAVDMFIKIKGIEGESEDSKHGKEIDVLAWSWGVSQSGTLHTGGGGGAGKASIQDISVTKWVDKASSSLMRSCVSGEHIDEATLTVRKAGKDPLEYLIIKLSPVLVTSVSTGGSGGEDRLTENITLNFGKVEYTYKTQDSKGAAKDTMPFKYDVKQNVAS